MNNKIKKMLLYFNNNKINNYQINQKKLSNFFLNIKSNNFNKINNNNFKKSNYFNSIKNNKELIKVYNISDKLNKPLINKNNTNISISNLINIYKKALQNLNKSIISYIKNKPLSSIFFNNNKLNFTNKHNQLNLNYNLNNDNKISLNKDSLISFINKLKKNYKIRNKLNKFDSKFNSINKKNSYQQNIRNYIKSKTIFNSKIAKTLATSNNYKFTNYIQINTLIKNIIYEFLYRAFFSMNCIISKPIYIFTYDKIIIQFFYLFIKKENFNNSKSLLLNNNYNLNNICKVLTRFFNKPIELDLIRIYYPYFNTNILVNLLSVFINKIHLRKIVNKFITKIIKNQSSNIFYTNRNKLLTDISGIRIKVAGRLLTQRIIPRKTIKVISKGALARNKALFLETARFTNKNKRGAFSITISIGHKLINS